MHELRSLQLFANTLTNKGLSAILDNCPYLESLDIRHCYNDGMDASLRAKCARIKVLRPPDDYDFHRACTPRRFSSSTPRLFTLHPTLAQKTASPPAFHSRPFPSSSSKP
uniref:Transport inhibitor response 1 domain-containing protein n=1 Tax=Oryza glumipatula TaxID=40148 RepID=A0A0E0ARW4_9ORYZ